MSFYLNCYIEQMAAKAPLAAIDSFEVIFNDLSAYFGPNLGSNLSTFYSHSA